MNVGQRLPAPANRVHRILVDFGNLARPASQGNVRVVDIHDSVPDPDVIANLEPRQSGLLGLSFGHRLSSVDALHGAGTNHAIHNSIAIFATFILASFWDTPRVFFNKRVAFSGCSVRTNP